MAAIGTVDPNVSRRAAIHTPSFACEVQLAPPVPIPDGAFDARRRQYSSVAFMLALAAAIPNGADRSLGLTECDLFIPMLTFVFGQAQLERTHRTG